MNAILPPVMGSAVKRGLFQIHRIVGITAGMILAFNGLTGATLAFRPQWLVHFGPEAQRVEPATTRMPLGAVVEKALHANPALQPTSVTVNADPTVPVKVNFALSLPPRGPGRMGDGPPTAPPPGAGLARRPGGGLPPAAAGVVPPDTTLLVNPYTGALLPQSTGASRFFAQLELVHRGMWAGNTTLGRTVRLILACSALSLFYMILSGLYLRWPKGRAARDWRTWFKVDSRLKGAAYLWRLHAVVGTFVLIIYLMSAHTGLMIGHQLNWYYAGATSIRQALGMPGLAHPMMKSSTLAPDRLDPVWAAFQQHRPAYRVARIELPSDVGGPVIISSGTEQASFDSGNGALLNSAPIPDGDAAANRPEVPGGEGQLSEPVFEALLNGNPYLHNGQRFGILGQLIMMCAGLCMPLMLITGWIMYAKRLGTNRRRQAR
jgi:uncharacterized iron-regulated membrane protein